LEAKKYGPKKCHMCNKWSELENRYYRFPGKGTPLRKTFQSLQDHRGVERGGQGKQGGEK